MSDDETDEEFGENEEESEQESEVNLLGEYEGERNEAGQRHGTGKCLLPNGDMYAGLYCKGLRYGSGLYVFKANGARYDGQWKKGKKHGQGKFFYPDGTMYEGDWKRDKKHGFGMYFYVNNDIYEGSWKKNYRHGLGTYFYADSGTKFMGTWIKDRMQGPGQLIHPKHRFHGVWETNLPIGRGCYAFDNGCMQHGHYEHIRDPEYVPDEEEIELEEKEIMESMEHMESEGTFSVPEESEEPVPLKKGIIAIWRARCITPYDPSLLPPEPVPLNEEASDASSQDSCDNADFFAMPDYFQRQGLEEEEEEEATASDVMSVPPTISSSTDDCI